MAYDQRPKTNRHYRPSQSFPDVLSGVIVLIRHPGRGGLRRRGTS
jgi:hypothetical protein